jgi:predicted RNA polymerase sigma factor
LSADGAQFRLPTADEFDGRLAAVLHVSYLVFNEGYATASGTHLITTELTAEAIRLARELHRKLPDDGEVTGLLALLLLTEARRGARLTDDGSLVPLAEQDRERWDRLLIGEGVALVEDALSRTALGAYQVQAAIAAVHDEAPDNDATDWPQILGLYAVLESITPNPIVTLNRAVALAMVRGPQAGLQLLTALEADERVARHHRLPAVRAHLYEMAGDEAAARSEFLAAARRTTSLPEKRYLERQAARLTEPT